MFSRFNRWLLNFLMSGWFFDDKKNKEKNSSDGNGNLYETKMDYVGNVTKFLEEGIKEISKDIKKL